MAAQHLLQWVFKTSVTSELRGLLSCIVTNPVLKSLKLDFFVRRSFISCSFGLKTDIQSGRLTTQEDNFSHFFCCSFFLPLSFSAEPSAKRRDELHWSPNQTSSGPCLRLEILS
ncbi:hypothetical protein CHARACLAT_029433 [Characodon lateralis]|uniref:Uncharacterized protein n=1 Tax=Characodon lateralis TaxID=208331 RepID=A0ABU7DN83_9TELE|nr:hypothetical protein [Characodon lateralis]